MLSCSLIVIRSNLLTVKSVRCNDLIARSSVLFNRISVRPTRLVLAVRVRTFLPITSMCGVSVRIRRTTRDSRLLIRRILDTLWCILLENPLTFTILVEIVDRTLWITRLTLQAVMVARLVRCCILAVIMVKL